MKQLHNIYTLLFFIVVLLFGNAATARAQQDQVISPTNVFIRAIIEQDTFYKQEGFLLTFRLYTILSPIQANSIHFPKFEDLLVEEIPLPHERQAVLRHYNGKNYFTIDLKKVKLFPQCLGLIIIPSISLDMTFSVRSGSSSDTIDIRQIIESNPITIYAQPL